MPYFVHNPKDIQSTAMAYQNRVIRLLAVNLIANQLIMAALVQNKKATSRVIKNENGH